MMETALMIEELTKAFNKANEELWENKLPLPMIIVSRKAKKHELGFITVSKVWHSVDGGEDTQPESRYEINISAECLERPVEEIIGILIHEMVHLYHLAFDVKDTSGGQVHNKIFKKEAERVGLEVSKGTGVGFGVTFPGIELTEKIQGWNINKNAFSFVREDQEKEAPPKKGKYKYQLAGDKKKKFSCKFKVNVIEPDTGAVWERTYELGDDETCEPGVGEGKEDKQ